MLVEPRGIEPLSENPSSRPSPSAVCHLKFPHSDADKQAALIGILKYTSSYKATYRKRSPLVDAVSSSWSFKKRRQRA